MALFPDKTRSAEIGWRFDDLNQRRRRSPPGLGGAESMFEPWADCCRFTSPSIQKTLTGLRAGSGWQAFGPASRVMHERRVHSNVAARRVEKTRVRNRFLLEWTHMPGRDPRST